MTTRQEAAASAIRGHVLFGDAVMPSTAVEVLAAADAADREAGIYRIKLDDELQGLLCDEIFMWSCDSVVASQSARTVLSVLRERAET